jgi:hypothetical protein
MFIVRHLQGSGDRGFTVRDVPCETKREAVRQVTSLGYPGPKLTENGVTVRLVYPAKAKSVTR